MSNKKGDNLSKAQFSTNFIIGTVVVIAIIALVFSNSYINAKAVKESYCNTQGPFTCKEFEITTQKTSGDENYILLQAQEIEDVTLIKESLTSNLCSNAYFDSNTFANTNGEEVKVILDCDEGNLAEPVAGSFELLYITSEGDVAKGKVDFNIKRTQTIFDSFQQEILDITETAKKEIPPGQDTTRVGTGDAKGKGGGSGGGGSGGGGPPSSPPGQDKDPPIVNASDTSLDQVVPPTEVIRIDAIASDLNGIKEINIYVDSNLVTTCSLVDTCSYSNIYSIGEHTYYATALDTLDNLGTSDIGNFIIGEGNITVNDTISPSIIVSHSPLNPTDKDLITFDAAASDGSGIKQVDIYVDDILVNTCYNKEQCLISLDPYLTGEHNYYATALDNNYNTGKSAINTFTVTSSLPGTYTLTVTKSGSGLGTVTGTGIDCGLDCTETYNANTLVTLTASASTGSTFIGWSGACTGTSSCIITMDASKNVNAIFDLQPGDITPPTVSVTHTPSIPNNLQQVTFTATASDASGIQQIQIYIDNINVITCTSSPCIYNGGPYTQGSTHTYYATALDNANNPGVDPLVGTKSFNVVSSDTTPPIVSVSHTPSNPTNLQQVTFTATASDASGLQGIKIYVDNVNVVTCTNSPCIYTSGPYTQGSTHTYYATALDNNGNTGTDPPIGTKSFTVSGQVCTPVTEICNDNIDNDCDNLIDCNDSDCSGASNCQPSGEVLAFPGAEGFGKNSLGGRGGAVYKVTNLDNSGTGSLKACIEASGPRVCIFETSGVFDLTGSSLTISNPFITIAGQTAPGTILLKGGTLTIQTHDVTIQHITARFGDEQGAIISRGGDSINMINNAQDVIIDHVSATWGVDEDLTANSNSASISDITISNSIIAEGLYDSINAEGPHARGNLINDVSRISAINNLYAHNMERNPNLVISEAEAINNLIYNWGNFGTRIKDGLITDAQGTPSTIPVKVSVIGNVYIDGPSTPTRKTPINIQEASGTNTFRIGAGAYLYDNMDNGVVPSDPWSSTIVSYTLTDTSRVTKFISPPVQSAGLTIMPSSQVESYVLANVGSRPRERDSVDTRIINSVSTRTGQIIDCVSSTYPVGHSKYPGTCAKNAGGWPNIPVTTRTLTVPSNPSGDDDSDGYTNLEEWLHSYYDEVE